MVVIQYVNSIQNMANPVEQLTFLVSQSTYHKKHSNKCEKCGSKWCMYMLFKDKLDRVVNEIKLLDDDEPAEAKRHMAYTKGIFESYGKLGFRRRKRVGFCYDRMVKSTFPSNFYTGFRGNPDSDSSDNSSSISRKSVNRT